MGIKLYGCIFAVDGFDLSKIPHNFACIILQTETWAPVSIKNFTTELSANKCFLRSYFFRILHLGIIEFYLPNV